MPGQYSAMCWVGMLHVCDSEEVTTLDVRTPLGEHVEYSHYDAHTRNEEIYQDLCSIDKKCTVATQVCWYSRTSGVTNGRNCEI